MLHLYRDAAQDLSDLAELRCPEECREALSIIQVHVFTLNQQTPYFAVAAEEYTCLIETLLRAAVALQEGISDAHREGDTLMLGPLVLVRASISRLRKLLLLCQAQITQLA